MKVEAEKLDLVEHFSRLLEEKDIELGFLQKSAKVQRSGAEWSGVEWGELANSKHQGEDNREYPESYYYGSVAVVSSSSPPLSSPSSSPPILGQGENHSASSFPPLPNTNPLYREK